MIKSRRMKERGHLEDLGIDVGIILKWIFKKIALEGVTWLNLAQDWDKYLAVVNTVMKLRFV